MKTSRTRYMRYTRYIRASHLLGLRVTRLERLALARHAIGDFGQDRVGLHQLCV